MKSPLPQLLALLLVLAALSPTLDVGFLADDYYMGAMISSQEGEKPGLAGALRAALGHRWTASFDVFRPLTILTLQADHSFYGSDGRRHHRTNVLLWLVCSWLFARLVGRLSGSRSPVLEALTILLFGWHPACVEAVAWLVAREDLLLAASALAGLLLLRRRGRFPFWALCLVPAFLAKETAVILPFVFAATDLFLPADRDQIGNRPHPLGHLLAFSLLAGYLGVRLALFGSLGGLYQDRPYVDYLREEGSLGHLASAVWESLIKLVAPVNQSSWATLSGLGPLLPSLAVGVPLGIILARGLVINFGLRRLLAAGVPWIIFPLMLLAVPLSGVGPDMERSRFLALPLIGFLAPVATATHRGLTAGSRLAATALVLLLCSQLMLLQVNLAPYREATRRAEGLLADIVGQSPPGGDAWLLRADGEGAGGGLHPALMQHQGAYVLSSGLFDATRPPFVPPPGIRVHVLTRQEELDLLGLPEVGSSTSRPAILRLDTAVTPPAFKLVAPGSSLGPAPGLAPRHGEGLPRSRDPAFRVEGPRDGLMDASFLRLVVAEPGGDRAEATLPWAPLVTSSPPGRFVAEVSGRDFRLVAGNRRLDHPLDPVVLGSLATPVVLWWAEIAGPQGLLLRSPYAVLRLAP